MRPAGTAQSNVPIGHRVLYHHRPRTFVRRFHAARSTPVGGSASTRRVAPNARGIPGAHCKNRIRVAFGGNPRGSLKPIWWTCSLLGRFFTFRSGRRKSKAKSPTQELARQPETSSAQQRVSAVFFLLSAALGSSRLAASGHQPPLDRDPPDPTLWQRRESLSLG